MASFKFIACTLMIFISTLCQAEWVSSPQKGWHWYKKISKPIKIEDQKAKDKKPPVPQSEPLSYRTQAKKFKEQFEEIQAKAVLAPTFENVKALQEAQTKAVNQASSFQEMWMLTSLLLGQGYRESDQPFPQQRQFYQEQQERQLAQYIRALAKVYGLFFIFKKECPYCHQFAPIVRQFIDTYGFAYKAISPDGSPLPEFPDAVADNGIIRSINDRGIYPALFLVHPQTQQVIPIAWGLTNFNDIKDNLKAILPMLRR